MFKVVLIANEPQNIAHIVSVLRSHEYQIICAADALSGLWYIENLNPDLILLDVDLSELSGTAIASRLNHLSRQIPIMALTTTTSLERYQVALACGCKVVFTQPIDVSQVMREIIAFLPITA
jgi:CheY-like chemotaxis protein